MGEELPWCTRKNVTRRKRRKRWLRKEEFFIVCPGIGVLRKK
jgi:orotidine-5'-phosphate decarboxylase